MPPRALQGNLRVLAACYPLLSPGPRASWKPSPTPGPRPLQAIAMPPMKVRLRVTGHRCLAPCPLTPVRTPWHPWLSLPHPPCWATRSPLPLSSPAPLPLPLLPLDHGCITHTPGDLSSPPQSPSARGGGICLSKPPGHAQRANDLDLVSQAATHCAPSPPAPSPDACRRSVPLSGVFPQLGGP